MKKKFQVAFTQYWYYDVEVDCDENDDDFEIEEEAIALAEEKFEVTMRRPIAHVYYDEVEVTELD